VAIGAPGGQCRQAAIIRKNRAGHADWGEHTRGEYAACNARTTRDACTGLS